MPENAENGAGVRVGAAVDVEKHPGLKINNPSRMPPWMLAVHRSVEMAALHRRIAIELDRAGRRAGWTVTVSTQRYRQQTEEDKGWLRRYLAKWTRAVARTPRRIVIRNEGRP